MVAGKFDAAFHRLHGSLGKSSSIFIAPDLVPLSSIAYEAPALVRLVTAAEIATLAPDSRALPANLRDDAGRWRRALTLLAVSTEIGTSELLGGFDQGSFTDKEPAWWVDAAYRLTAVHPDNELFGRPFRLSDDGAALACTMRGETQQPLIFGATPSPFAALEAVGAAP